jgi:hypothetical protein
MFRTGRVATEELTAELARCLQDPFVWAAPAPLPPLDGSDEQATDGLPSGA